MNLTIANKLDLIAQNEPGRAIKIALYVWKHGLTRTQLSRKLKISLERIYRHIKPLLRSGEVEEIKVGTAKLLIARTIHDEEKQRIC